MNNKAYDYKLQSAEHQVEEPENNHYNETQESVNNMTSSNEDYAERNSLVAMEDQIEQTK